MSMKTKEENLKLLYFLETLRGAVAGMVAVAKVCKAAPQILPKFLSPLGSLVGREQETDDLLVRNLLHILLLLLQHVRQGPDGPRALVGGEGADKGDGTWWTRTRLISCLEKNVLSQPLVAISSSLKFSIERRVFFVLIVLLW